MEDAVAQLSSWRQCPFRSLRGKIHSEIVVVGLRESGKSALVNALFSEEVSQEREASSKSVKGGDKHVISYKGNTLAVWDTCGFLEHGNPENEDAFKAIEAIPCMKKNKCSALVVTIAIAKTRFEKNSKDIEGMKKLKEMFGADIWGNLLIVLTQANHHYDIITSERTSADEESYLAKYSGWVKQVRTLLASELMPTSRARSVPIVPAGYINSIEPEGQVLQFEPKGKSWVLDIWQNLAKVVPMDEKPLLLDVCINKLFASKFFFLDSFLSLVTLTADIYKTKVCLIKSCAEYKEASLALSLLHNMVVKLDNHDPRKRMISSETHPNDSEYWKNLEPYVNIVVTGLERSGKTSLINSLAHQKEIQKEEPYAVDEKPPLFSYGARTCTYYEASLESLEKSVVDSSAVTIVCIKISESNANLTKILGSFSELNTKHFVIALTYANAFALEIPFETLVETQTANIKKILSIQPKFNPEFVESVTVVPVGYHSEPIIKNDPTKMNWIMNLWLQIISNAKTTAKAALLVMVNYNILGRKPLLKNASHYKKNYVQQLVKIMIDIVKENELLQVKYDL